MTTLYVDTVATKTVPGTVSISLNRFERDGKEYLELYVRTPTSGRLLEVPFDEIITKERQAAIEKAVSEASRRCKLYMQDNPDADPKLLVITRTAGAFEVTYDGSPVETIAI